MSALNPVDRLVRPMHVTQRLTLDVPEAGGLVWVVDGQADSSDVLQSLWRERVVTRVQGHSLIHPLSADEQDPQLNTEEAGTGFLR